MLPLISNDYFIVFLWLVACVLLAAGVLRFLRILRDGLRQKYALVDIINAQLPQTQCGQCGYAGCLPYARAVSQGEAINKCPPGGAGTIRRLSILLNESEEPLDPAHGQPLPPRVALIREAECIGCTKCIQACPVDAILGAAKLMHTVIEQECTGCDLCVAPCPVDCIDMIEVRDFTPIWQQPRAMQLRQEYSAGEDTPCQA